MCGILLLLLREFARLCETDPIFPSPKKTNYLDIHKKQWFSNIKVLLLLLL